MHRLFTSWLLLLSLSWAQAQGVKAVYHLSTGIDTAWGALTNVRNHLAADPQARIVVVSNGPGIDFMLSDGKDSKGHTFAGAVGDLAARGVEFRVCNNTLQSRGLSADQLLMEAQIVPSGVAEVAKLQSLEGFGYIKP